MSSPDKELLILLEECLTQIKLANQGSLNNDCPSCLVIIHRATTGEEDAINKLIIFSIEIAKQQLRRKRFTDPDDLLSEVAVRLLKRLKNSSTPLQISNFSNYRAYVGVTLQSCHIELFRKAGKMSDTDDFEHSLEISPHQLVAVGDKVSAIPSDTLIQQRENLQIILKRLDDKLAREAVYRRIALDESPDEITEALQTTSPGITKRDVYRIVERSLHKLRNDPIVKRFRDEL